MALICHCEGVRDRTIVKAIHRGASTLAEVQAACGAATRCGGCEPAVLDLIARHAADAPASVVTVRPAFG
ncbi:MAG: (2Fe-2S)-binding protein [Ilumatobacteraceae bacterium]|nr:(2Fe-2S)-binding protein [Acidimicrobiales bacterium]